jgi:beta-barrel assembly-enhancing protease
MSTNETPSLPRLRRSLAAPWTPLAAVLVAIGLAGCATSGVNRGDLNLISLEEEWELGQQLEGEIARQVRLVDDASIVGYVDRMGKSIVATTELADLPWEFHVVADPAINAFNVPGGHVYVNTGLIAASRNAAELAAVMAHEIAHGVARHGTENLTKTYGLSLLASAVLGKDPRTHERIAAQILGGGALARFSREAEREADELGIRYMYDAGYDPHGMAGMFETLLAQRQRQPGSVERFFSSHPVSEERLADAGRRADELPDKRGLITEDSRLASVQREARSYG